MSIFPLIFTGNWEDNWVYSKAEGKEFGKFELTAGKFYNDAENDKGMQRYFNFIIHENRVICAMVYPFSSIWALSQYVDTLHETSRSSTRACVCTHKSDSKSKPIQRKKIVCSLQQMYRIYFDVFLFKIRLYKGKTAFFVEIVHD